MALSQPAPRSNEQLYTLADLIELEGRYGLTVRHLRMMEIVKDNATKKGYTYFYQSYLGFVVGLKRRQTQAVLQDLCDGGYLKSVGGRGKKLMLVVAADIPRVPRQIVPVEKPAQSTAPPKYPTSQVARSAAPEWRGGPRYPGARSTAPQEGKNYQEGGAPGLFDGAGPVEFHAWRMLNVRDEKSMEERLSWAARHGVVTHARLDRSGPARPVTRIQHSPGAAIVHLADPDEQRTIRSAEISRHWFGQWADGGEAKANASSK